MSRILEGIAAKIVGGGSSSDTKYQDVPGMLNTIFNLDGDHGSAITTVVKKTLIGSNVYIESTLNNEDDFMVPLMSVLCQTYVGYVLTALQIYQSVDRYRTISNTIGRVATESITEEALANVDPKEIITSMFSGESTGMEALRDSKFRSDIDEAVKHLAAGRLIEFDFTVSDTTKEIDDPSQKADTRGLVTVPLYVQLYPTSMPPDVAEALVQFNYPERFWRRLAKAMSREIHFFRDFILGLDMVNRHDEVLKKDTNNVLSDFYKSKISKQST